MQQFLSHFFLKYDQQAFHCPSFPNVSKGHGEVVTFGGPFVLLEETASFETWNQ